MQLDKHGGIRNKINNLTEEIYGEKITKQSKRFWKYSIKNDNVFLNIRFGLGESIDKFEVYKFICFSLNVYKNTLEELKSAYEGILSFLINKDLENFILGEAFGCVVVDMSAPSPNCERTISDEELEKIEKEYKNVLKVYSETGEGFMCQTNEDESLNIEGENTLEGFLLKFVLDKFYLDESVKKETKEQQENENNEEKEKEIKLKIEEEEKNCCRACFDLCNIC